MTTEYVSINEARKRLKLTRQAIYARIRSGTLKAKGKQRGRRIAVPVNGKATTASVVRMRLDPVIREAFEMARPDATKARIHFPDRMSIQLGLTPEMTEKLIQLGLKALLESK